MGFGGKPKASPMLPPAPTPEEIKAREQRKQEAEASRERATRVGGGQATQAPASEGQQAADTSTAAGELRKKASKSKPGI